MKRRRWFKEKGNNAIYCLSIYIHFQETKPKITSTSWSIFTQLTLVWHMFGPFTEDRNHYTVWWLRILNMDACLNGVPLLMWWIRASLCLLPYQTKLFLVQHLIVVLIGCWDRLVFRTGDDVKCSNRNKNSILTHDFRNRL